MFKSLALGILCLLVFGSISAPVRAWDDVGHKITGYIAWQRMSPGTREKVIKILRSAPEDSHLSAYYIPYGPTSDEVKRRDYFILVPYWADIVRDRTFPNRFAKYHQSNWHYSDTFWRQVDGKVQLITDRKGDGLGESKLVEFDAVMRDAKTADPNKALAIAWFLHIGGDLHQPLHTSGRHTESEPKGDMGGNLFLISPEGTRREDQLNLHWFWDSIVLRNVPLMAGQSEEDYICSTAESMMLRHPFSSQSDLALGRYSDWQQESFRLANSDVFRADLVRFQTPVDEYRRNAFHVAERRLALAGYRMGETLEQIFK